MIAALLTVPHGGPGNDTGAAPVAQALHRLLQRAGLEVRTLINRAPRESVDMNRPEGRGSAFRNAIGTLVQKETVGLLIDIHSFPGGDETRFGDRDIVLLSTEDVQTPAFYRRYVDLLREGAAKLGCPDVDVAVMPAEYVDDVVIHANELGQPPARLMLAEHNADGPADLYAGMHLYAIGALFGAEEVEQAEYVDEALHEGVIDGVITWFRKHAKRLDQQWNELPKLLARVQNARAVAVRARPWPWLKFYIFKSPRPDCQPFQLSYFKHDEPVGHDCVPSIAAGLTKVWKTWGALEVDGIVEGLCERATPRGACSACHSEMLAVEQEAGDLCMGCEAAAEPKTGVQMGEPSVINKPFDFRHEPHAPDSRSIAKTDPTGYHGQHLPKGAEIKLSTGDTKKGERRLRAVAEGVQEPELGRDYGLHINVAGMFYPDVEFNEVRPGNIVIGTISIPDPRLDPADLDARDDHQMLSAVTSLVGGTWRWQGAWRSHHGWARDIVARFPSLGNPFEVA